MSPTAFNLRHLRILAATVRLGNFGAAGRAVGVTQPAVTQAIAKLEKIVARRLIDRNGAHSRPTDAGILLAARAEAAAAALASAVPSRKGAADDAGPAADISMAQLNALLAVADHGSYAAAAAALGLSQPSVHRAVGELERALGLTLVERSGRGIRLAAPGDALAAAARLALSELQAGLDELAVLAGRDQGTIRLGAHPTALVRLVPQAVTHFLAEHRPVVIQVEALTTGGIERLRDGRIDMLLVPDSPALQAQGLESAALLDDPLLVAARAGHPLLAGPTPGLLRLAQAGWAVAPPGSEERAAWDQMFLDGGLYPPQPGVTCPADMTRAVAERSDLLAIAPSSEIQASGGRLAPLGAPVQPRRLMLATRAGWAPTPAQATFVEELRPAAGGAIVAF